MLLAYTFGLSTPLVVAVMAGSRTLGIMDRVEGLSEVTVPILAGGLVAYGTYSFLGTIFP